MADTTKSIAGRAHGAPPPKAKPQTKEYRPQLEGLPGVHPDVARAIQTVFDNLYTLRSQVQSMAVTANASSGSSAASGASGTSGSTANGSGSGGSGSSGSGASSNVGDNILGLKINAATDPSSLQHGGAPVYNSSTGQFNFATPAGFVSAPASPAATGVPGQITHDGSYVYVCTGSNQWARSPLSTWTPPPAT